MRFSTSALAVLSLTPLSLAAPAPAAPVPEATPAPVAVAIEERQLLGGLVGGLVNLIDGVAAGLINQVSQAAAAQNPAGVVNALVQIKPKTRPTSIQEAIQRQQAIWASPTGRTDFYVALATQVAVGLGPLLDGTLNTALTGGLPVGENSINNNNLRQPARTIYPTASPSDPKYSLPEDALRKAIYFPPGFTYGRKTPVLFVPGTGSYGGINFANNLRKLLTGKDFADPVWLNVPGAMLGDAQLNAEYIAYAINYISSVSQSKKIAVISWSQGGLDTQWVLKYWPSTRKIVNNFLPVSPDFKGTVLANVLCLSLNSEISVLCDPSVIQQEATSQYVAALRSGGGDSALVPTTTFYSGFFDEIVQPQSGTGASAFLGNANGVPVSNNEVQVVCAGQPGGTFYDHAGVLYNPLVYALIVDALTHGGPGDLSRINVKQVCSTYATPGLDLDDVIATVGLIPIAGALLLTYPDKRLTEPPLKAYAR